MQRIPRWAWAWNLLLSPSSLHALCGVKVNHLDAYEHPDNRFEGVFLDLSSAPLLFNKMSRTCTLTHRRSQRQILEADDIITSVIEQLGTHVKRAVFTCEVNQLQPHTHSHLSLINVLQPLCSSYVIPVDVVPRVPAGRLVIGI